MPEFPVAFVLLDDILFLRVQGAIPWLGGVWLEPHHLGWENRMPRVLPPVEPWSSSSSTVTRSSTDPYDDHPDAIRSSELEPFRRAVSTPPIAAYVVIGVVFVMGFALGYLTALALT